MSKFKRNLITTALPYANGPVHIGHLAGVYVPADIYVRYLRLKKKDVLFICGSPVAMYSCRYHSGRYGSVRWTEMNCSQSAGSKSRHCRRMSLTCDARSLHSRPS